MKQSRLKIIRVGFALLIFLPTTFIFLDFRDLVPVKIYRSVTFLQFVPSLMKYLTTFSLISAGFIVVIIVTSLVGRVYCSAVCPLGIFQDLIARLGRKIRKKPYRYKFRKPNSIWRYGFLALPILICLFGGGLIGVYFLDPYSIFGRIILNFGQPVYQGVNNLLAKIMESMNIYLLYPEDIIMPGIVVCILPALMLIIIVWFSLRKGRLYCNSICPVGTLLGLISRVSVFQIRIREDRCTKCAKCAAVCKAGCIDLKHQTVDSSRCVACFNCIGQCSEDAIQYQPNKLLKSSQNQPVQTNNSESKNDKIMGRRNALTRIAAAGLTLAGLSDKLFSSILPDSKKKIPSKIKPAKNFPVSPPGSLGIRHFTSHCTACHLCVSACPTGVLQPSLNEYGLTGIMQPHMDYSTKYCNFDCTKCSEICPSGAILSISLENKKSTQIGQVHFIRDNCIVYSENTACGSCSEHCPTQAVTMVPFKDNLTIPEINPEICVGCGACEYACPVQPYKAIYVDGNEIHQVAKQPQIQELEEIEMEDFPF